MKSILLLALSLTSASSFACQLGDKTKTLLVVRETPAGEENAGVADVVTATQQIEMLRNDYYNARRSGDVVSVDSLSGETYVFDLATAARVHGVCFPVVYAK